jgi:hypothetical protein
VDTKQESVAVTVVLVSSLVTKLIILMLHAVSSYTVTASVENFTLKETIAETDRLLNQENVIAERGNIIVNVSEREILRSRGEYSG